MLSEFSQNSDRSIPIAEAVPSDYQARNPFAQRAVAKGTVFEGANCQTIAAGDTAPFHYVKGKVDVQKDNEISKSTIFFLLLIAVLCCCALFLAFILVSLKLVSNSQQDSSSTDAGEPTQGCAHKVNWDTREGDEYISLFVGQCFSEFQYNEVVKAVTKWNKIIVDNMIVTPHPESPVTCGLRTYFGPNGHHVKLDHLVIDLFTGSLDGPGDMKFRSIQCLFDATNTYPVLATIHIDSEDFPIVTALDMLSTHLIHEIGHILGIGTTWKLFRQDADGGLIDNIRENESLLQEAILEFSGDPDVPPTIHPEHEPFFNGHNARREFALLKASDNDLEEVPVENGRFNNADLDDIDIKDHWGASVVDRHWRYADFYNEVMVAFLHPGIDYKLSVITIAALEDMGYIVDYAPADDYSLPVDDWLRDVGVVPNDDV